MQNSKEKKIAEKKEILEFIDSQLTKDFIGEKYLYYRKKWEQVMVLKKFFRGINWVALFLGPIWLAYRKMYLYLIILIVILILSSMVDVYFNINIPPIVFPIVIGISANSFYFLFVHSKISKLKAKIKDENLLNEAITKQGGVSVFAATMVSLVFFLLCTTILVTGIYGYYNGYF